MSQLLILYTKPSCTIFSLIAITLATLLTTTLRRPPLPHHHTTFLSSASNTTIATHLHRLTTHPHLAGTPPSLTTTLYVHSQFQSLNLPTHLTNFTPLLSYPLHSSLSHHFHNHTFHLRLSEPNISENGVVLPYHAYSPSGSVYSTPVFLNYGAEKDYNTLAELSVDVTGCVGIVRRGEGMSRYEVVANAARHGVAAVVMYTEGEWKGGVERGTVLKGVGDPLTPGWAGGQRLDLWDPQVVERFPDVPSIPISEDAAREIMRWLGGAEIPKEWGMSGFVGPGPALLNFTYEGEKRMATIHNVFAEIKGYEEPDRFVLLGNHRDAWTYGAVDPNSGTSVLLDIARRYALLMQSGWRPRRTIILCSWDAEEFGMIGSTEWVEQNLGNLGSKAVAYLNVDCASQGPGFFVSATPQLDDLLVEVTKKVSDPEFEKESLYATWTADKKGVNIERLSRVDSDFAPFLHHAGVPSVDLYFGSDFPVYHTAFDSYDWIKNTGDPLFKRHVAVAGVWGLVALRLADDPVLPFNYLSYADELMKYENVLKTMLGETISVQPITDAIEDFVTSARQAKEEAKKLREDKNLDNASVLRRRALNDRLILAERGFLEPEGLIGKQWFKHLIYGPRDDPESKISFFPGIADGMSQTMNEDGRQESVRHEIWRAARAIRRAAFALRGNLT